MIYFQLSPSYLPGREGDLGRGHGKLVAMARKKMSIAGKAKVIQTYLMFIINSF